MQTPSISLHLANILKSNWRLPAPPDCPAKVFFILLHVNRLISLQNKLYFFPVNAGIQLDEGVLAV